MTPEASKTLLAYLLRIEFVDFVGEELQDAEQTGCFVPRARQVEPTAADVISTSLRGYSGLYAVGVFKFARELICTSTAELGSI